MSVPVRAFVEETEQLMSSLYITILNALVPAAVGLLAGSPFGAAVWGLVVGAVFSLITFIVSNVNTIRFHEGSVCLGGHHLSPSFVLFNIAGLHGVSGAVAAMSTHMIATSGTSYGFFAIVPGMVLEAVLYLVLLVTSIMTNMGDLRDDWQKLMKAARGEGPPRPNPRVNLSSVDLALRRMDTGIDRIFYEKDRVPPEKTVEEFERALERIMVMRGDFLGVRKEIVEDVREKLVFKDPQKRREWLDREMTPEVWEDVRETYHQFCAAIASRQNEMTNEILEEEE